jgi:DMSO/TMAO reductase YedYZ molybdopterin-dependent catalytic subunit
MNPASHTPRPAGSPAYYLGRPASWWIAAMPQRRTAARYRPAAACQEDGLPAPSIRVADSGEACQQAIGAGLVVHQADPLNAETPLPLLAGTAVIPSDRFYVRNHFGIPDLDPTSWRLEVGGLAAWPRSLTLAELRAMPSRTAVVTLECVGNGRSELAPPVPREQWGLGAVGTAAWTGVPLTDVLDLAAPQPDAREVVFRGADSGRAEGRGGLVHFERSLPLRYLGSAGALLAYSMNGQPLPQRHGYPLRLIVPGWYGVASVKWLTGIELTGRPFAGHFQVDRYHIDGQPVTLQAVRSVITEPRPGEAVEPGDAMVRGLAWSGAAPITGVEVSIGNQAWQGATLIGDQHPHGWQSWQVRARLEEPGRVAVRVRAIDAAGRTQPGRPVWNPLGYAVNPIHQVMVSVRSSTASPRTGTKTRDEPASVRRRRRRISRSLKQAGSARGSRGKRATAASRTERTSRPRPAGLRQQGPVRNRPQANV